MSFFSTKNGQRRKYVLSHSIHKTFLFLICLQLCIVLGAKAQGSKMVNFKTTNEGLSTALTRLGKESGVNIIYPGEVNHLKAVKMLAVDRTLEATLRTLLEGTGLVFRYINGRVVVYRKNPHVSPTSDSLLTVSGFVYDEAGSPLGGVAVMGTLSKIGAISKDNGSFTLKGISSDELIDVSALGFAKLTIEPNSQLNIVLKRDDSNELADVLVNTGYQTLPKERATGSFTVVDNELFNRSTSGNILERLEGVTNGMLFTRNNLQKEDLKGNPEIRINGVNTILGNRSPLIVVDNFPYNGDIDQLNPNDVESVTVLRDAAAASIWGALAGNGVIVITTKSGRYKQRAEVSFNTNVVLDDKPDLFYSKNFLPASTVMDIQKEMFDRGSYFRLDFQRIPLYPELLYKLQDGLITQDEFDKMESWYRGNDLRKDWSDLLYQQGVRQQNGLTVRGGGDNYHYAFTANYDNYKENYVGNKGSRLNLSLQNTFKITPNLELTGTVWYTNSPSHKNAVLSSIINSYNSVGPDSYESLVDMNGNPNAINLTSNRFFYQEQIQSKYPNFKMVDWLQRPLDEIKYNDSRTVSTDLRLNGGLKYKFLKHFSADLNFQYINSQIDREDYYAPESYYVRDLYNKFTDITTGAHPIAIGGILDRPGTIKSKQQSGRALLNYNQRYNAKHEVAAIAGAEMREYEIYNQPGVTLYNYDKDLLTHNSAMDFLTQYRTIPMGVNRIPTSATNLLSDKITRDLSYFGNASYTYNNKYILSGSMRWDGSNLLGVKTNQRGTVLWSSGLAWDVSKEAFYGLQDQLPYLKLRATYGSAGNIDRTQTQYPTIRDGVMDLNRQDIIAQLMSAGNPSLRWEQVRTLNFGADFSAFHARVNGSIEYYHKYAGDLLGSNMVDPTTGVPSNFKLNYGAMQTWGWDIQINSRNLSLGKFSWNSSLIFNTSGNKITKLKENVPAQDNQYITLNILEQGVSVDNIYALPWYGLNPQNGSVLIYDADGQISDKYLAYWNGLKKAEFIMAGSTVPKISTSLMNTFEWNGISVSALLVGHFKSVFRRNSMLPGGEFGNLFTPGYHMDYFDRWQKPGDEKFTDVPAGVPATAVTSEVTYSGNIYKYSEALITKGDVIRLQDITVGYTIPASLIKKWHVKRLRVYGYARNLGIVWRANDQGLDPDYPNTNYPAPKSYSFGIQVDF